MTQEQIDAVEELVQRRMINMDETREEATQHLVKIFEGLAEYLPQ